MDATWQLAHVAQKVRALDVREAKSGVDLNIVQYFALTIKEVPHQALFCECCSVLPCAKADNWNAGVTPLCFEKPEWKCWGLRHTEADARARMYRFDPKPVATMCVLQITITPIGLLTLFQEGLIEIINTPQRNMRIYGSLERGRRRGEEVLYSVSPA